MDLRLKDLHVFITGSAGDIGRACAAKYLEHGAKVTLHYNSQATTLASLTETYPTRTTLVQADLSNEVQTVQAMKTAVEKFGPCHILVANHAIYETTEVPIQDMSLEQFKHTIDVNLVGVFLITREFMKQLKAHADTLTPEQKLNTHASIAIIGSTAGKFGEANHIDYSASKSALMYGFNYSLKNEIIRILPRATVNVVAPGWVRTSMAEEAIAQGLHYKALRTMPLAKVATVEDCSNAVLMVTSPVTGGHISGVVLSVDGGMEGRVLHDFNQQ